MFTPKIIKKIKKAGLIGRGCNNFPTAQKWQVVRRVKSKEKFVICNVSESEPGVFKDKYILENFSPEVIDGIALAMKTVKATKGFVYLNPEYYEKFQDKLSQIISIKNLNIELYQKPLHDYIGGEETALINSMQGLRVEPRLKPPYPTTKGLFDSPTLVNNAETFYAVSLINSKQYKKTRFYCLSGDDVQDEVKELPVDLTVLQVLKEFDHTPVEKYFYQVGGMAAGSCFNHKQLNRGFNGLAAIIIYKKSADEKKLVEDWINFFVTESCGQCVPCREGTYRLQELLQQKYAGHKFDKQLFEDVVFSLQNSSFCPLGRISTNAILTYYKNVLGQDITNIRGEKCDVK